MRRTGIAVVVVLTMAGCGHSKAAVSDDASSALQAKVAQIRVSASHHDAAGVTAELSSLRDQVTQLRQRGDLTPAAAQKILDAAAVVGQNLAVITTTTTTTTAPPEHGHGKDKGDGGGD